MLRYIKRLCTAMLFLLTTLSLAVAVEFMLVYLQSNILLYAAVALMTMLVSIGLCNAVIAAIITELSDIVTERVLQNCGKIAENKLENYRQKLIE